MANQQVKNLTTEVVSVIKSMDEVEVQTGIELGAECQEIRKENSDHNLNLRPPIIESPAFNAHASLSQHAMGIPETSYSSSEDEDFFDASENMGQTPTESA